MPLMVVKSLDTPFGALAFWRSSAVSAWLPLGVSPLLP